MQIILHYDSDFFQCWTIMEFEVCLEKVWEKVWERRKKRLERRYL